METPVTDTTKLPFDFEAFACTVFCAFVSHGDNNEAAMRSALTEAGFDALLAKSDRADALEAGVRKLVKKWRADESILPADEFADELASLLPADGEVDGG